jgi:hypothetical protein
MQGGGQHVVISGQINALPVMSFMRLDMQLDYGISKVEKTETSMWGFDWRIFQMEFSQMETYDRTKDMIHNFDEHIADGDNVDEYDYCSIMHYGAWFFSKNGQPTIEVIQTSRLCGNNQSLGRKNGLSNGDIAAENSCMHASVQRQ